MGLITNFIIESELKKRDPEKIGKLLALLCKSIIGPSKIFKDYARKISVAFHKEMVK